MSGGRVLPWRLAAGVLIHFCLPAYALAALAACLWRPPADAEALGTRLLHVAGWFAPGYLLLTLVAAGGAAVTDRWVRRRAGDAGDRAEASARRLAAVPRTLAPLADHGPLRAALDRLTAPGWNHADEATQALTADLDRAAHAFAAAHAVHPADRAATAALAADAIGRLATAAEALDDQRRRQAADDARTHAAYVHAKYPDGR